ncbi:MAG TPA: RNA polymerase sigma factor [Vicinamibacteria bacterium]|nr:RNA polymerase sigma factor [Vicinamibacteria bacterium]
MPRQQTSASGAAGTSPGEFRLASDEALFEGIRDGSERHFNALYDRYFRRVYAFVHARVRDHADAEELVQESFTAVFRGIAGYSGRSTPLAWIYGIAKNTINNYRRRLRAQTDRVDAAGPEALHSASAEWRSTPLDDVEMRQSLRRMDERLHSVTGWQVEVFWLRHVDDLSIDEIAQRLDRSNDAIRSSLYRVKRLLVADGEGDAARSAAGRA